MSEQCIKSAQYIRKSTPQGIVQYTTIAHKIGNNIFEVYEEMLGISLWKHG